MTRHRPLYVTPEDVALLRALRRERSLAAAARTAGMGRDRAVYRAERLSRIAGGEVLVATRGGRQHGSSRLTSLGQALLERGSQVADSVAGPPGERGSGPVVLEGRYLRSPYPRVRLAGGLELAVGFRAPDRENVRLAIPADSVLVARHRFPTSARNALAGRIERVVPVGRDLVRLEVRCGAVRLASLVTRRAVRALALTRHASVVLYIKATSARRL